MSEVVHYKGSITIISEVQGLSFSDGINKLRSLGHYIREDDVEYDEDLVDYNRTGIIWLNNCFYKITRTEVEDSIIFAEPTESGYLFELKYYNGGCGFTEALESAIKRAHTRQ